MRLQTTKIQASLPDFCPDIHYFALVDNDSREEIDTHSSANGLDKALDAFAFYIDRVNIARQSTIERFKTQNKDPFATCPELLDISKMHVEKRWYRGPGYCLVLEETYDVNDMLMQKVNNISQL